MKRTLYVLIATGVLMAMTAGCSQTAKKQTASDPFVEDLIKKMTLEEKVGQMTQITLEVVSKRQDDWVVKLDPAKLREAILKYHVGSILNCGGSANTFENWQDIITAIQDIATKETRLKVPVIYGIDSIHGANYIVGATLFPQSFAMSAAGNVDLVTQASAITAKETRAAGIPWNFNPVLDMSRNPLWSRFWENFGEDPYLSATMAYAYVRAQQGDNMAAPDKVAACMKHYLGYSVPLTGKDRTPAWIPERMLRELFLPSFAAGAKAGVATVMVNSSEINGIPVHSYKYALDDILRGELGFDGFIVSDWADIDNLFNREKVAASQREAVKIAVMAGIDMSMVPYDYSFYNHLVDLVQKGEVPMSRIDQAVRKILKVKKQLGLFANAYPDKAARKNFATAEATQVNLQAAQECITLLKNTNNVLPLAKDKKVLVTGPTANLLSVLNGGWTITWQGDREDLYPAEKDTVLEAVQKLIGKDNVAYVEGTGFDKDINTAAAVEAAKQADVVIACIGEKPYCETPGNINDLTLEDAQLNLVAQLAATGKPVVLVLLEGRPRIIRPVVDAVGAIVMAYLPGLEGGTAVASVLFGDINPSGKLSFTYPKYTGDLTLYDCKNSEKYEPQWGFGHGLSYTTFGYANLKLGQKTVAKGGTVAVSVDVTNTGKIAGKEIVQLYLKDLVRSVTPPQRQLKRFTKIELKPGETKTVKFELTTDDMSFIGRENTRIIEPGAFEVMVANLKGGFTLK